MPSLSHEALVMLFRNRPELAPELLRMALGVELPAYTEVRIESAELTQVAPTEYHADLVVLLVDGRPVLGIVLEVQLDPRERKRFTWPLYVVALRARLECPACVLVVTPYREVARWAMQAIVIGPGAIFHPLVVGPDGVPKVTDPAVAAAEPELAVLSAMAHGGGEVEIAVKIAMAAEPACAGLPEHRALVYSDLIRISLSEAARKALEELMANTQGYEFQSEFARRHEARGQTKARAEAVITFLDARGLPPTHEQHERILGCADLETLGQWVRKAATVSSVDELFE
ncbi:hypothetical protein ACFL5O_11865 [Myxococcota bacterium]